LFIDLFPAAKSGKLVLKPTPKHEMKVYLESGRHRELEVDAKTEVDIVLLNLLAMEQIAKEDKDIWGIWKIPLNGNEPHFLSETDKAYDPWDQDARYFLKKRAQVKAKLDSASSVQVYLRDGSKELIEIQYNTTTKEALEVAQNVLWLEEGEHSLWEVSSQKGTA
jgi:hypothetical protein